MHIRARKFLGTVVLLAFLVVYALIAGVIGATHLTDATVLAQTLFYAIAGLAWVVPAALLVRWMQRP